MATLSLKSFVLWFSNLLLPFVLLVKSNNIPKEEVVEIVNIFTRNAQLLYFVVLCLWVVANVFLIWIKIKKDKEILEIKNIERKIVEVDFELKKEELKRLKDENN